MAKKSGPNNLVSVGDIAKMLGVSANAVHHMRARDMSFPKPANEKVAAGNLYNRSAIVTWARKTGRIK